MEPIPIKQSILPKKEEQKSGDATPVSKAIKRQETKAAKPKAKTSEGNTDYNDFLKKLKAKEPSPNTSSSSNKSVPHAPAKPAVVHKKPNFMNANKETKKEGLNNLLKKMPMPPPK